MPVELPVIFDALATTCFSTETERAEAFAAAYHVELPSGYTQWVVQVTTPAVGDQDKVWLRQDAVTLVPQEVLLWSTTVSNWVRLFSLSAYAPTSGGAANAYTSTYSPALNILDIVVGKEFAFKATFTNTGAATWNPNGLGAYSIKKNGTAALVAGDIVTDLMVVLRFDGTNMQMVSTRGGDSVVSISNITPGTDRQIIRGVGNPTVIPTWQDLFLTTANQAIPAAGAVVTVAHGLTIAGAGVKPGYIRWVLLCTTIDNGYAVGDEVDVQDTFFDNANTQYGWSKMADTTNLKIIRDANMTQVWMPSKTGGTASGNPITEGSWSLKAYYA